jgi:monoamine oxidase
LSPPPTFIGSLVIFTTADTGISGCVMARQLAKHHLNFKWVEAQPTLGGRIQSTEQGLDLGPTWFWPHQHSVKTLLDDQR